MSEPFPRRPAADVDELFLTRWSPRAFSDRAVAPEILAVVFEAARWAPSCFNDQPWLFLVADGGEELETFRSLLVDNNRKWADRAPVLGFVLARRHFARNGKPNAWAAFDSGAAWMSLALQAHRLGLFAHGMGGIHKDKVYEVLGVPEERYEVICGFALGYQGEKASLPADLQEREAPSERKDPAEVWARGAFPDRLRERS